MKTKSCSGIDVMADYGCYYGSFSASDFEGHPKYNEIAALEEKFVEWANWFSECDPREEDKFPWGKFHETGTALVQELATLVPEVPVFYRPPYEDPIRGESEKGRDARVKIEPAGDTGCHRPQIRWT